MKPGDFVHCLEEEGIFVIRDIIGDTAWLDCFKGHIGWKSLSDLTEIDPQELKTRINELAGEITFLTCS